VERDEILGRRTRRCGYNEVGGHIGKRRIWGGEMEMGETRDMLHGGNVGSTM
jgi:hypothetical protein